MSSIAALRARSFVCLFARSVQSSLLPRRILPTLPFRKTPRNSCNQLARDMLLGATNGGTQGRDDNLLAAPFLLKMVPSMTRASRFWAAIALRLRCLGMAIMGRSGVGLPATRRLGLVGSRRSSGKLTLKESLSLLRPPFADSSRKFSFFTRRMSRRVAGKRTNLPTLGMKGFRESI